MGTRADQIFKLIDEAPAGVGLPVIFNGFVPRLIGRAKDLTSADALLLEQRLSATYLSRAQVFGRACIIAHG